MWSIFAPEGIYYVYLHLIEESKLLLLFFFFQHPKFFSGGLISNESPNEEAIKKLHFSLTIVAKGWTEKLNDPTEQHKEPPNKEMITRVSGVNPGYGTTCVTLLMSALMIVKESYRMPGR